MVMSRPRDYYVYFTEHQLWEHLRRCEANVRGFCLRICNDAPSRRKQLEWIESAYDWSLNVAAICEELERRGLAPRG